MAAIAAAGFVVLALAIYKTYSYFSKPSRLSVVPRVRGAHWLLGHARKEAVDGHDATHEGWAAEYGHVYTYGGILNRTHLVTTDPRAIRHILHRSDVYPLPALVRRILFSIVGDSVIVAQGDAHRLQRKVLSPAFGPAQLRTLTGIMLDKANELRDKWDEHIVEQGDKELDALDWLSRCTLDIIGQAGFGYAFDTLSNTLSEPNELHQALNVILGEGKPGLQLLQAFVPVLRHLPTKQNKAIRHARSLMESVGRRLLSERQAAAELDAVKGESGSDSNARDLLSLIMQANMAEEDRERLPDGQALALIPGLILAGHETTSTVVAWVLFELSTNHNVQVRLRAECSALVLSGAASNNAPLDADALGTLDKLPLLDAVIRETLRLHAPFTGALRTSLVDDEIPLAKPFVDAHGVSHDTIPVSKGDWVFVPIRLTHRTSELWGADALDWRPERWMDGAPGVPHLPGVWGNTLSFSAGPRSCIGFRFALHEIKIILHTLLCAFEVELAVDKGQIELGGALGVIRPRVRGAKETSLPIKITRVTRAE